MNLGCMNNMIDDYIFFIYIWYGFSLAPAGTYKVQGMLQQGGWGCAQGGYTGVFTPMWLMVARKPLK